MLTGVPRDREETPFIVKAAVGAGLGYALYRLLGTRGQGDGGSGSGGRRGHAAPTAPHPRPEVPVRPPTPAPTPVHRRDEQPVRVLVRPDDADPARAAVELDGRVVSVGELVARVDAGGRRDVVVSLRGDTRQGAWEELRSALAFAGVDVMLRSTP